MYYCAFDGEQQALVEDGAGAQHASEPGILGAAFHRDTLLFFFEVEVPGSGEHSDPHFVKAPGAHNSGRPPQQLSVRYESRSFIPLKFAL